MVSGGRARSRWPPSASPPALSSPVWDSCSEFTTIHTLVHMPHVRADSGNRHITSSFPLHSWRTRERSRVPPRACPGATVTWLHVSRSAYRSLGSFSLLHRTLTIQAYASRFESRRRAIWTVELEESSGGGSGASGRSDRCFQFSCSCVQPSIAGFFFDQSKLCRPTLGCLLIRDKL